MRTIFILTGLLVSIGLTATPSWAAYPDRPITMVVPYSPGGAADAQARMLAAQLGSRLGTSVVVDNKPGASGTIGAGNVARAAADGYTILYDATPFSINPALYPRLPYSTKSFQPLSLVSIAPNIVIVRRDSPIRDVKDLIARAKTQPGKLTYASGGSGTVQRLAAELFRQNLKLDMLHIPYKSGSLAITDVLGGQVDFMFSAISASSPLVASGKLRALAVTSPQRSKILPDVPTISETVIPNYAADEWHGVLLPAGTPAPIVAKLSDVVQKALQSEEVKKRFGELGAQSIGSTPDAFADFLKKEQSKWADVVRKGHIQLD